MQRHTAFQAHNTAVRAILPTPACLVTAADNELRIQACLALSHLVASLVHFPDLHPHLSSKLGQSRGGFCYGVMGNDDRLQQLRCLSLTTDHNPVSLQQSLLLEAGIPTSFSFLFKKFQYTVLCGGLQEQLLSIDTDKQQITSTHSLADHGGPLFLK